MAPLINMLLSSFCHGNDESERGKPKRPRTNLLSKCASFRLKNNNKASSMRSVAETVSLESSVTSIGSTASETMSPRPVSFPKPLTGSLHRSSSDNGDTTQKCRDAARPGLEGRPRSVQAIKPTPQCKRPESHRSASARSLKSNSAHGTGVPRTRRGGLASYRSASGRCLPTTPLKSTGKPLGGSTHCPSQLKRMNLTDFLQEYDTIVDGDGTSEPTSSKRPSSLEEVLEAYSHIVESSDSDEFGW